MRIYTKAGDLAFSTFTFPDGQPHFKLEVYEVEFRSVTVETAIRNPSELLQTCLVSETLRRHGYSEIRLDVRYLMGARMDRAIASDQPFTLDVVARVINSCGFSRVRVLDVHSDVATRLIRNCTNLLPLNIVNRVIASLNGCVIVCPDKGAVDRVNTLTPGAHKVYCRKERALETGALSGFKIVDDFGLAGNDALIIDDICDGGGTFVGLAKELRKAGAKNVHLFVTHGIFSKGLPLEEIDKVFTTDSFRTAPELLNHSSKVSRVNYFEIIPTATVIPVFMQEL